MSEFSQIPGRDRRRIVLEHLSIPPGGTRFPASQQHVQHVLEAAVELHSLATANKRYCWIDSFQDELIVRMRA
jgi:hypothetical protein